MSKTNYWLFKSEPNTYSYDDLVSDKKTNWDGVRNYQARNFLREVKPGDLALIYHSGDERAVVGVSKTIKGPYPDLDPKKKGDWVQVDIKSHQKLKEVVSLKDLKANSKLKDLMLIRQSRLSVMPIKASEFNEILKMGKTKSK